MCIRDRLRRGHGLLRPAPGGAGYAGEHDCRGGHCTGRRAGRPSALRLSPRRRGYRPAQGFYRHIHTAYTTICDEKGKPLQAIGISRDVTGEVELKTRFTQEQQYRNTMISDAVASYKVNLSRDTVQQMDGAWTEMMPGAPIIRYTPVSYTHLDVYKRQV